MEGKLLVISGLSAAGKGTIVKSLIDKYKDYVSLTVTGINVGDVLKQSSEVNVKVMVNYDNLYTDEEDNHIINLNDLRIRFEYKE